MRKATRMMAVKVMTAAWASALSASDIPCLGVWVVWVFIGCVGRSGQDDDARTTFQGGNRAAREGLVDAIEAGSPQVHRQKPVRVNVHQLIKVRESTGVAGAQLLKLLAGAGKGLTILLPGQHIVQDIGRPG